MTAELIPELDLLSEHINVLMGWLDFKHYQEAKELKAKLFEHFPVYKAMSFIRQLFLFFFNTFLLYFRTRFYVIQVYESE